MAEQRKGEGEVEVIHSWSPPRSLSTSLTYSFAQVPILLLYLPISSFFYFFLYFNFSFSSLMGSDSSDKHFNWVSNICVFLLFWREFWKIVGWMILLRANGKRKGKVFFLTFWESLNFLGDHNCE